MCALMDEKCKGKWIKYAWKMDIWEKCVNFAW